MLVGSLGGLVTMAIHPVAVSNLTASDLERLALTSGFAHSLAIISFLILMLGAVGLVRHLATADRLAFSGLVVFAFANVAVLIATSVSGFIMPRIMSHMMRDVVTAAPQWHIVIDAVFQINQAFSSVFTVAAAAAIALWSVSALRNGGLAKGTSMYGRIVAAALTLAICSGHLTLSVHGMSIVVAALTIWFVAAGVELLRNSGRRLITRRGCERPARCLQ